MSLRESELAPVPRRRGPLKPLTRLSIERIIGRSVAVFSVVFGAQAVPFAIGQQDELKQPWGAVLAILLFGGLLLTAVAGFSARLVSTITAIVPIMFVVALITWPLSVSDPAVVQPAPPWLWFICNIALAAAVVAFSPQVTAVYLVVVPAVYAVVRTTPSGGGADVLHAVLDAVFTAILGAAILILAELLRRASDGADAAQAGAVARYAEAVRQHATEVERTTVDSIVHDGVLTAMLSAARAFTARDRTLAVGMAEASMNRLASAAATPLAGSGAVPLTLVRDRLEKTIERLALDAAITPPDDAGDIELSGEVAQSLGDAAVQALVNSRQHAGDGVNRWVSVTGDNGVAVIRVGDDGAGFDPSVRSERLGVRVSILERVAASGGRAEIESAPGEGTIITLRWPHEIPAARDTELDD
ncbi:sensor histidine kinase [Frondihabitans australicus]|uniref:Signal transduction histidine kinase n=1 Tax=Frondihabitans australicus TaxID=386892 RepID=A0A495IJE9_9MICO|nr:ATP-binding protein [Frondihabitans australicus]RKR75538.1 signal transduction histidine kinase [Frondihabitans australicus]